MIIGAHVVVASKDVEADLKFFRDVLEMPSVDAGGGYTILGLPVAEASIHETKGDVPQHELYLLCDDINTFTKKMAELDIKCGDLQDAGWGQVVELTLPSGAPFHVYEPRHKRPSD
jgi:catechol 2,3-dioxygenase-like lactoylglutathione lyase family enzyme